MTLRPMASLQPVTTALARAARADIVVVEAGEVLFAVHHGASAITRTSQLSWRCAVVVYH